MPATAFAETTDFTEPAANADPHRGGTDAASAASGAGPAAAAPRADLYAAIHKALRLWMTDTLTRLGRLDTDTPDALATTLGQLDELLDCCGSHAAHENEFLHAAIEAGRPGSTLQAQQEHEEQLETIAALQAEAASLRAAPTAAAAHRLYRHVALFVAENLQHMNTEETVHNAALWAAYDDAGLIGIEQRLLASIGEREMAAVLRWMLPALTSAERIGMIRGMQQQMPPEAMRGVLALAHRHLDDTAWARLARAIGVAPVPGLMTA